MSPPRPPPRAHPCPPGLPSPRPRGPRRPPEPRTTYAPSRAPGSATSCSLRPEHRTRVVELDHAHGACRRGVHAQLAEDALVEVLAHDLEALLAGAEDVDGTDLGELGGELGIARDRFVDLDVDEERVAHGA